MYNPQIFFFNFKNKPFSENFTFSFSKQNWVSVSHSQQYKCWNRSWFEILFSLFPISILDDDDDDDKWMKS